MRYGVIMAGGSGTRLWPLSRGNMPKQLLPVINGKSLLQLSYERLRGILPPGQIFVCTGAAHAQAVLANLPELPAENLLGEPMGRDTANAIGFSAAVLQKRDPEAICAVVTADHVIEPVARFQKSVEAGFEVVAERPAALVTFGIVPTHGHTGLGYIHRGESLGTTGAYKVLGFYEKPDKAMADRYVESGRYYWNSGMFVWRCDTVLKEIATHLPGSHRGLSQIADAWGTDRQDAVLREVYPRLPKISIDYAVMEPASHEKGSAHVVVVEMPVDWLDVGSWPALAETLPVDEHNNAVDCPTGLFLDSDDNVIICQDANHLVSTIGVSDMIIVHARDATLICPKDQAQRVKELVAKVKDKYGDKFQ
ncbi:MAG: mannose-1-phosphate guanylyltransferase [Planctomycetota bacterium]|nr:mannose-1-phosphate guanylyltransferase [Planctomycetota bacterium]